MAWNTSWKYKRRFDWKLCAISGCSNVYAGIGQHERRYFPICFKHGCEFAEGPKPPLGIERFAVDKGWDAEQISKHMNVELEVVKELLARAGLGGAVAPTQVEDVGIEPQNEDEEPSRAPPADIVLVQVQQLSAMKKADLTAELELAQADEAATQKFQILDKDDLEIAGKYTRRYAEKAKVFELERTLHKEPWLRGGQEIDALYQPVVKCCERIVDNLKGKILAVQEQQAAAQLAAYNASSELAAQGEYRAAEAAMQAAQNASTDLPEGVGARDGVWNYEVLSEIDVPRQYLSVDARKVRAAIKAGVREIPGLYIYRKKSLAVAPAKQA